MDVLTRKQIAELCGVKAEDIPRAPLYSLTNYDPPGPVAAAFIRAMGPIDAITGPAGSGKSVASIFKVIRFSISAMPICRDGRIRVRGTVIRDNFRALYRTTLRSWFEWFPPDYGGALFTGGQDRPAQHVLKLSTVRMWQGAMREIPVDLTVDFFAIGDLSIEELLKAYETSWVFVDEGDLLPTRAITFSYSRTGRYPSKERLEADAIRPRMVAVCFNPPSPRHPLWLACKRKSFQGEEDAPALARDAEAETPSINFFHQPSGLSAEAENRKGKTRREYEEDARTLPEEDVRRFVHGLPGYVRDGKPIYAREFDLRLHVADEPLAIRPGLPLHAGFDQGNQPAAVFFQEDTDGQIRVLAEVVPGHGVGTQRFAEAILPLLHGRLRGLPPGTWSGDPAGFYGADRQNGELAMLETLALALGHPITPAPSNEPQLRWDAVRMKLRARLGPERPGLILDPSCQWLLEGFEADYKFIKQPDGSYAAQAKKNEHSNPHDALQYGILGHCGRMGVMQETARAGRPGNVVSLASGRGPRTEFNIF